MDEKITVEQFLFGGWDDPMKFPPLEGFHHIQGCRPESDDTLSSFDTFKEEIRQTLSLYAWDGFSAVDMEVQGARHFGMPDDETIRRWFEREKNEEMERIRDASE